jgi:hypothetical protein
VTVGHEAAHLRGVRAESKAESLGARFAYDCLLRTGAFARHDASDVVTQLLDDSQRRPAYKIDPKFRGPSRAVDKGATGSKRACARTRFGYDERQRRIPRATVAGAERPAQATNARALDTPVRMAVINP